MRKLCLLMILVFVLSMTLIVYADIPTIGGNDPIDVNVNNSSFQNSMTYKATLMIYMVGSNLESDYGQASKDIMEMAQSGANFNDLNVVIAAGGAEQWDELSIGSGEVGFGSIRRTGTGTTSLVWDHRISGSISTVSMLTSFLQYSYDNFPADTYHLVFWNHGGGPMVGYGHDEVSNCLFSLTDLRNALDYSPFRIHKMGFIGFDACLMGSYEVAAALEPYAEYMVASEETEPGSGWDYTFIRENSLFTAAGMIGMKICDLYADSVEKGFLSEMPYSLSVIRLEDVDKVTRELDKIFQREMTREYRTLIARAAYNSCSFGLVSSNSTYDLYDLVDFGINYDNAYDGGSIARINFGSCIFYNRSNIPGANGLSFYYPLYTDPSWVKANQVYNALPLSSWYASYLASETGAGMVTGVSGNQVRVYDGRSRYSGKKKRITEEGINYRVQLTDDEMLSMVRAEYVLLSPGTDDRYQLIRRGNGLSLDGNTLTASISNKILSVQTEKDGGLLLTSIEKERNEKEITYFVPVSLIRDDVMIKASLQVFINGDRIRVGQFVPDDGTDVPPKMLLDPEPGDRVVFQTWNYEPFYDREEGELLPFSQWTDKTEDEAVEYTVGRDGSISLSFVTADESQIIIQITVTDVYGNEKMILVEQATENADNQDG